MELLLIWHFELCGRVRGIKRYDKGITEYPVAELIVATGFFVVLSLEQIVMTVCVMNKEKSKSDQSNHGHGHETEKHESGEESTCFII